MKKILFPILLLSAFYTHGQGYWQQTVNTKIDVRLDDRGNYLHAKEEIEYTNNSPDTLRSIYMHLWANAYKHDHTPYAQQADLMGSTAFYYSKPKDKGYIDSLDFTVDGQSVEFFIPESTPDIARMDLKKPLLPHQTIKIVTPFQVKIPVVFSRLGHVGQAYCISQWFPKPAVYDKKGWHPISYLDQGEFYSEYGTYDVNITLPKNYVVMATGNCIDESENKWLDSLAKLPLPSDTLYRHSAPASDLETKTLHFHEENIHDFAWFADKRWVVRKDTVTSPGTSHLINVWAAFTPRYQKTWTKTTGLLRETVLHYGKWVGPYHYNTMKAVVGDMHAGGGMEYPTVTIIDKGSNSMLKTVIVHEAGHNWFYGLLGSNERDHAWMDEGINSYFERRTNSEIAKEGFIKKKSKLDEEVMYYENAVTNNDQALEQTSANFEKTNYGLDVYTKSTLMHNYLQQYMGTADFDKGMKAYYDQWHYKHPYPEDFRACMQANTKKSLSWFFDGMMHSSDKIDFTITNASVDGTNTTVTVRNKSNLQAPVLISAYNEDSLVGSKWIEPFSNDTSVIMITGDWTVLKVDSCVPDANRVNNIYRSSGLSHRFPLHFKAFMGLNRMEQQRIFYSPAVAYNQYDGFSAGLLFHNITVPEHRFRFIVAPLFATGSNSITGAGSVGYLWYPSGIFHDIMLQADGKTFHNNETLIGQTSPLYTRYSKMALSLNFTFNQYSREDGQRDFLSTVKRTLLLKGYSINEENFSFDASGTHLVSTQKVYGLLRYEHKNERTYNPFSYKIEGQGGADFAKLSAEGNARVDYNTKKKSLYIRAFIGKYFAINNDPTVVARYELNSSYSGINDYLYDGTYIGRNATDHMAAQQISMQEGGFKVPVFNNIDRSDNWMATINLSTDLPRGIPFKLFFDAGIIPNINPTQSNNGSSTLLYEGGIELRLVKNLVSVYFPIVMSNDYQNYLKNTFGSKAFARSISFTMQLQDLNWLRMPEKVLKPTSN